MKKLIPPILFLMCVSLMIGLHFFPSHEVISSHWHFAGIVLLVIGLVMVMKTVKLFTAVNTEVHTFKRPKRLVTSSLFKYSRNPIYLGFAIGLLGIWATLGGFLPVIGFLLFVITAHFWYIPYEEKNLEDVFGDEYRIYKSQVGRWL